MRIRKFLRVVDDLEAVGAAFWLVAVYGGYETRREQEQRGPKMASSPVIASSNKNGSPCGRGRSREGRGSWAGNVAMVNVNWGVGRHVNW